MDYELFLFLRFTHDKLYLLLIDRNIDLQKPFYSVGRILYITERNLTFLLQSQLIS